MNYKIPAAMDSIPRQKNFVGLSLKFGSIITALIIILYSVLSLAQCLAAFNMLPGHPTTDDVGVKLAYAVLVLVTISHTITLSLTALMLVGVLREKGALIRPWIVWTTVQVIVSLLLFVFWSTTNLVNHSGEKFLLPYIIDFVGLMIRFYVLIIVSSFYKELVENLDENERLRQLINSETWYNAA